MFAELFNSVKQIPFSFYTDIVEMSKSLQKKLRLYSDATTGKMNPEYVSIPQPHAELIDSLRANDPQKYEALVAFANIYPTLDVDVQPMRLIGALKRAGILP